MLKKLFISTGLFPNGAKTPQLYIDKKDGRPLKGPTANSRLIRPGLKETIVFYSITETVKGLLVSISDGKKTRYYWSVGTTKMLSLLVDKPSRTFEGGWLNLFEGLTQSVSKKDIQFYNQISFIVPEILEDYNESLGHPYFQTFKVKGIDFSLRMSGDVGDLAIQVTASPLNDDGVCIPISRALPLNNHPVSVLFNKLP